MMLVFIHAVERIIYIVEENYAAVYRQSADYQRLCKKFGRARANMMVDIQATKIVSQQTKNRYRAIVEQTKRLKQMIDQVSDIALTAACIANKDVTGADAYDAMRQDVNFLLNLYALCCNCEGEDDAVKILSTVKVLAKVPRVTDNILSRFQ